MYTDALQIVAYIRISLSLEIWQNEIEPRRH